MEYKRYISFLNNENAYEFRTYLTIQLNATCNGFQHLSLLSNEETLFKELNLIGGNDADAPSDFYSFLVHMLGNIFNHNIKLGNLENDNGGSYERLRNFVLERSIIKKVIMTIPYNVYHQSMRKYVKDNIHLVDIEKNDNLSWYSKSERQTKPWINNKYILLLVNLITSIIQNDFEKLKKLLKYLRNIATILTLIGLPIFWSLPHGLIVRQSYLETKSVSIRPFFKSKAKINIQITDKNNYNKKKSKLEL